MALETKPTLTLDVASSHTWLHVLFPSTGRATIWEMSSNCVALAQTKQPQEEAFHEIQGQLEH